MNRLAPAARKRWQATVIITLFMLAVAGAAFTGWRFARESPPHQGPIVLITVDGLRADTLPAYGGAAGATPNIDALAGRGIVFERAYTHSPLTLPAHAALVSGQLPFDNGVRDDGGFALKEQARTIAALLRNRGFNTGAAVSSFLLRRSTGLAQGFSFYDADIPDEPLEEGVLPRRDGLATFDAAEQWIKSQSGQRYFLFLQVDARSADAVVGRLVAELKRTRRYTDSTIVFTAAHGDPGTGETLDDSSLRVPLIVKQPGEAGAGRRVPLPVQHIDLLPTLLDVVRAPMPSGLRGRSLRAILDKTSGFVPDQPIYAELLAPLYRFDGQPLLALSNASYRFVRGIGEQLVPLVPDAPMPDAARQQQMGAALDKLLLGHAIDAPVPPAQMDEDRLAAFGYLAGLSPAPPPAAGKTNEGELPPASEPGRSIEPGSQAALTAAHRRAASLVAQKKYSAALDALRAISTKHQGLASVQYQIGSLLVRTGRIDEGIRVLTAAAAARPDDPEIPVALASALLRARRADDAAMQAEQAVALADAGGSPPMKAAAHEIAARVALGREDIDAARLHAAAAQKADPHRPLPQFVTGRLAYDDGRYEEALTAFKEAAATVEQANTTLAELHLNLGNTYARLDRYAEAEAEFQEELREYPHNIGTYASLAMLYRASNRDQAVEHVIGDLVEAAPTPEGYSMAARLWTIVGERARAEALRSDARRRFRGDPSLALLGGRSR
ncbi:MAG TPA: sulfatase-like hydrolase/transferase [Vicinamibacterales bacterium]|nr:sulfatase-like hydrolase/transferase [Vicinamibacterales bacterium]